MGSTALPRKLAGRYEIRKVLGEGGMGLVYRAYDSVIRREVALKTIRDIPEPAALQLFQKECDVLASMSHPNIVEIFDIGELEEDGKRKPYFVMPLLLGSTLDVLIRQASHRLTVERSIQILSQTCRGLQAAHERGLVHRDLKPSNIFVMEDDSVKIIDFGVAHITDAHSTIGQKGTLTYMSPEQIEMKPLSALSDLFSLSVVSYEVLTGRQPFRRANAEQIVDAILHHVPPPASELNAGVNDAISRVIHKGMAKQPWHRFSCAREYAECLNKAVRNEPIECFDPNRIRPRMERANRAFDEGDYQYAGEILGELQAEGHLDPGIGLLRQQIDRAVRQRTIVQLLESAKARFEEQEDPLALQKIQDILQLEPDNAPALGLKAKIENRRSERQIESWYKLASQHIGNHAYSHAREALQNVLQLRPMEGRAAQLLGEVDRHEQEYNRLRQEKVQLHRAAMEAYQKGEVSTALSKLAMVLELDRQAPDSSNPERSNAYQTFYNKVRSEHDAMNNAYAEARKQLADRAFAKALALCDSYLAKYPGNALFQALKFDIEEQQRQELSAYIATVDRQVESEPDLEKRVNILKEAVQLHPDESHFQRALRLTEDKRDLVNSIVARAHLHEEQNLWSEAFSDWEILRTIYSQYPGLKFEIERIQKRREQQTRDEARARWIDQIDACMRSCEFARALSLIQRAQAEFPEDAEFSELGRVATENAERADKAQALLTEGQDLCAEHRFTEGISLLRQAHALVANSPVARSVLANALLEQAQSVMEQDVASAEALVQEAAGLNPGNPLAKSLRSSLLDRRKEQFVGDCVSQARRYQAAGDLGRAVDAIQQGIAQYPQESRLLQVRESLNREVQEAQSREGRLRDLEEVRRLAADIESAADSLAGKRIGERILSIAERYPRDPEFAAAAGEVQRRATQRPSGPTPFPARAVPVSEEEGATRMFSPLPVEGNAPASSPSMVASSEARSGNSQTLRSAEVTNGAIATKIAEPATVSVVLGDSKSVRGRTTRGLAAIRFRGPVRLADLSRNLSRKKSVLLAVSGFGAFLLVSFAVSHLFRSGRPATRSSVAPGRVAVSIQTDPPGATIKVNGDEKGLSKLQTELPPGSYHVEAALAGHQPAVSTFEVKAGAPANLNLTLASTLPLIRLSSDSGAGKVVFDGQTEDAEGGQWAKEGIVPGEHKLKYSSSQGDVTLTFQSTADSPFKISRPVASSNVHAVIVAVTNGRPRIFCTFCPAKLSVDGQPEMDIGADGTELAAATPGSHRLALRQGSDQHVVETDFGAAPTLSLFLSSDANIASLLVVTGEDQARVFLDGQPYKRQTKSGQLLITNLVPKKYAVRVAKVGFQDIAEQSATLVRGQQSRLVFKLVPSPKRSALTIAGAVPGAEVLLDQVAVGEVRPDGSFSWSDVGPGDHVVELRKDSFAAKQIRGHFSAGSTLALGGTDTAMDAAKGSLRIAYTPSDAVVTLARTGESPITVTSGVAMNLLPGSYTLSATNGVHTQTSVVQVLAGQSKTIDLSLAPEGMSGWEVPGGWRQEGTVFTRKGGGLVFYKAAPSAGTFTFSAMVRKGHRLQWVVNGRDDKNYFLFEMDDEYLSRSVVQGGQSTLPTKFAYRSDRKKFRTFRIQVTPGVIVTQIQNGQGWDTLDRLVMPGVDLAAGKFGMLIPNNDEVLLANFSHYADQNVK